MNTHSLFGRLRHSSMPSRAGVALVALAGSSLGFCSEIHVAAGIGDLAKVQALLKSKPDLVFSKDEHGATPLHVTASAGTKDVVEVLRVNKAKVNATDDQGQPSGYLSARNGHQDVVELLCQHGADK